MVSEIHPGLDRFMVKIQRGDGVEIQHHSISKDADKLINKQVVRDRASLDGMD